MSLFGIGFGKSESVGAEPSIDGLDVDEPIQKGVAFFCFYTMVFVALCTFMPSKVAFAANSLLGLI